MEASKVAATCLQFMPTGQEHEPDTAVRPEPGRTVRTLTISQDPAEDGTPRDAGRRALLGQDSYRGVRTESGPAVPNTTNTTGTADAAVTAPSAPRAVFTGPTTALPGAGTEQPNKL